MSVRPLTEQWFPAGVLGAESLRERGSAKAYPPINFLHVWWARRPLTASRAGVVASLLPAWPEDDEVAADPDAAAARKGLEAEFAGGEDEYRRWFLRAMGILGDPVEELRRVVAEARGEMSERDARWLSLCLAFALDNNELASWDATRTKVRNTFDRHDFSFKWSFAEFDGADALLPWVVNNAVMNHEKISALAIRPDSLLGAGARGSVTVNLGSATDLPLPAGSIDAVVTDPPYYDNVMYAELADFFYVWLKRSLRDTWPELCSLVLSDKEAEAVANPSLFDQVATRTGRGKRATGRSAADLTDEHYEELLTRSFTEAHRVLKDDGVMTVMFTHKRVDAWDTLGQALLEAGFSVSSSWPVHTESEHSLHQAKKNAASSTILLTCRKRGGTEPAYWADIRGQVAAAARSAAAELSADGLVGIDLTMATFGPVLSVLSRNWPVYSGELRADGSPQVLRPDVALDMAREEVAGLKKRGLLGGREVSFDRVTDWWLLA